MEKKQKDTLEVKQPQKYRTWPYTGRVFFFFLNYTVQGEESLWSKFFIYKHLSVLFLYNTD